MQFWYFYCLFVCFLFVFVYFCFCFFLFNNPVSSRICKLPIRCEIHNCTFKNTNKVSIIIIVIIINSLACSRLRDSGVREIENVITPLYFRAPYTYSSSLLSDNLVPRVLSYPPYKTSRAGRREPWERGWLSESLEQAINFFTWCFS